MSTTFTWAARLADDAGQPVAGVGLDVQLFDLKGNGWTVVSSAKTTADGVAKGAGAIDDDTLPFAPAFRLVEGEAAMSVSPQIARLAKGGLRIDFGQVQHLSVEARFAQPKVIATNRETLLVGGIVTTETPPITARDLSDRDEVIALQLRTLAERDAEIAELKEITVKLDAVTASLQKAEETVQTLSTRLADRDKDLADRDALLADRARVLSGQTATIAGLQATVAEQEKAIAATEIKPALGERSVGMIDLATKMATQLDDAQTALKPRGFSLGAIQVTAKAVLQDDGSSLELLGKEDLKTVPPGSLSDIKLEFIPEKSTSEETVTLAPDVGQLTESAARRVLASVGLVLDSSVGPRALNPGVAIGQAMVQSPVAGSTVPRGAKVLVIFAADAVPGQQEI